MNYKQKKKLRIALIILGEMALLSIVAAGIRYETKTINRTVVEVSELRDPSPFRAILMGHLGKIFLGVKGHLSTQDPAFKKQVEESRRDFESSLPEFVKQNPKLFPPKAAEEIQRTFIQFDDSLNRTFETHLHRRETRNQLEENFRKILQGVEHRLRPLIRKDQADGDERAEAVLNIENQARAWQDNLARAWAEPTEAAKSAVHENDNRGQTHLERYGRLELLVRERKVFKDIRALWLANSDLVRESFVKETLVNAAENVMNGERQAVISVLNQYLPAMPPAELNAKKQKMLGSLRIHLVLAFVIGALGIASLAGAAFLVSRAAKVAPPIANGIFRMPVAPRQGSTTAREPTLQMDLQGTITGWSAAAETFYGYKSSEAQGQSIGILFESESEIGRLGQKLQEAKEVAFDTVHKNKAGESIPVRIEFCPVSGSTHETTAIGLICSPR